MLGFGKERIKNIIMLFRNLIFVSLVRFKIGIKKDFLFIEVRYFYTELKIKKN